MHNDVQLYYLDIVFLLETLSSQAYLESLRVKLGFVGILTWDKEGRNGVVCV